MASESSWYFATSLNLCRSQTPLEHSYLSPLFILFRWLLNKGIALSCLATCCCFLMVLDSLPCCLWGTSESGWPAEVVGREYTEDGVKKREQENSFLDFSSQWVSCGLLVKGNPVHRLTVTQGWLPVPCCSSSPTTALRAVWNLSSWVLAGERGLNPIVCARGVPLQVLHFKLSA